MPDQTMSLSSPTANRQSTDARRQANNVFLTRPGLSLAHKSQCSANTRPAADKMAATLADNYHRRDGAASSLSHGPTPSNPTHQEYAQEATSI